MHLPLLRSTQRHGLGLRQTVFAVLLALLASPSLAQPPGASPFAALPGAWSGTGTIAMSSGAKERIRCRAAYRLDSSSTDLRLEMSCASDSYKFELQSHITYSDNAISGSWNETTRGVGGTISGSATPTQIRAKAEGQTFTAILAMNTRGPKQSVSVQSPATELSTFTLDLTHGSNKL